MKKIALTVLAGTLALGTAGCFGPTWTEVCMDRVTKEQVDEDHCEEGEVEYDPSRYMVKSIRVEDVVNEDSIMETEDEGSAKVKTSAPKATPKPKATTKRR